MSDDLTVSGGGSIAVSTAELSAQHRMLLALAGELDACAAQLALINGGVAEHHLADARLSTSRAVVMARTLSSGLASAAVAYGAVEGQLRVVNQQLSAALSYGFGLALPSLVVAFGPALLFGGSWLAGLAALAPDESRRKIGDWLQQHEGVLSDPQFISLVRYAVMSADDFGAGVLRLPPQLAALLGDDGLGILGVATSAGAVVAAANAAGVLVETPVAAHRARSRRTTSVASGFAGRADRIPRGDAQIRIDRYVVVGAPDRFEVFLGGTKDASPTAGTEAWDMTSNLNAMALGDAGSYRAAEEAMRLAGIRSDSPVQFTGYSQGGLVAALLASSGDYDTRGLLTVGGPIGQIDVPAAIPFVAIEHADDLIPATGGLHRNLEAVVVRRNVFDGELPGGAFPAHQLEHYRETAALLDASGDLRSGEVRDGFAAFGKDVVAVQTTLYRAERAPNR